MQNGLKNIRSKYWTLILYEDSENLSYSKIYPIIIQNYENLCIKHDKDIDSNGELIKQHYHIVLKFKNYKWLFALADELQIELNYLQPVKSLSSILCYLIHYNTPNKHQYELADVYGTNTFYNQLKKTISNQDYTEEDKISLIVNFIYSSNSKITYKQLVDYILAMGYWSEFRRSATIINRLLDEHNSFLI